MIREVLDSDSEIKFVADRPAHDRAYRMDSTKYEGRYGEIGSRTFAAGLEPTIAWYLDHRQIFERLTAEETSSFIETHYRDRL